MILLSNPPEASSRHPHLHQARWHSHLAPPHPADLCSLVKGIAIDVPTDAFRIEVDMSWIYISPTKDASHHQDLYIFGREPLEPYLF